MWGGDVGGVDGVVGWAPEWEWCDCSCGGGDGFCCVVWVSQCKSAKSAQTTLFPTKFPTKVDAAEGT